MGAEVWLLFFYLVLYSVSKATGRSGWLCEFWVVLSITKWRPSPLFFSFASQLRAALETWPRGRSYFERWCNQLASSENSTPKQMLSLPVQTAAGENTLFVSLISYGVSYNENRIETVLIVKLQFMCLTISPLLLFSPTHHKLGHAPCFIQLTGVKN